MGEMTVEPIDFSICLAQVPCIILRRQGGSAEPPLANQETTRSGLRFNSFKPAFQFQIFQRSGVNKVFDQRFALENTRDSQYCAGCKHPQRIAGQAQDNSGGE